MTPAPADQTTAPHHALARRGLMAIFGSTFLELVGVFMLSPPALRGRYVGLFETMVGTTFVVGPAVLAWVGPQRTLALTLVLCLMAGGLLWSLLIPPLPREADANVAPSGARGMWRALSAHPVVMVAGFVGGFFESGVSSLLPLYGLALGLPPAGAALLVSASGLGSALMMLPAGLLVDRMAFHPHQRWGTQAQARQTLMRGCAWLTLAATAAVPWVAAHPLLAWPVVFVWGGAGGCLYTLAMIDIGSRETGLALVNGTAVLVMAYTLGGVLAPAVGAVALDVSAAVGFPSLMLCMAAAGVLAMHHRLHEC